MAISDDQKVPNAQRVGHAGRQAGHRRAGH